MTTGITLLLHFEKYAASSDTWPKLPTPCKRLSRPALAYLIQPAYLTNRTWLR